MQKRHVVFSVFVSGLCALAPITVLAGAPAPGSITFESAFPGSVNIPTMGGIGLVLLAGVLALVAVQHLRGSGGQLGSFLVTALLGGALLSAGGGVGLISQSHALVPDPETDISDPDGGTFEVQADVTNRYNNVSGGDLVVADIQLPQRCADGAVPNRCAVNATVEDAASCVIECSLQDQPNR